MSGGRSNKKDNYNYNYNYNYDNGEYKKGYVAQKPTDSDSDREEDSDLLKPLLHDKEKGLQLIPISSNEK